jgi:hypothetical protein
MLVIFLKFATITHGGNIRIGIVDADEFVDLRSEKNLPGDGDMLKLFDAGAPDLDAAPLGARRPDCFWRCDRERSTVFTLKAGDVLARCLLPTGRLRDSGGDA